jgi:hypothetical protein
MSTDSTSKPLLEIVKNAKKPTGSKKAGNTSGGGGGGSGTGNGSKTKKFGDYLVVNGAFHQSKVTKDGDGGLKAVDFALCNFTAHILEEIASDNGLDESTFLRIKGRRADGTLLPMVDVPAKSFYSPQGGNWANEHWGTLPFIYPGAAKKGQSSRLYSPVFDDER